MATNTTAVGAYENRAVSVAATGPGAWQSVPGNCDLASVFISTPSTSELTIEVTNAITLDSSSLVKEWDSGRSTAGSVKAGFLNMPITAWRWNCTVLKAATVATVQARYAKRRYQ